MVDRQRARRLGGRIQEIVAAMIESGIKDPRLGMVTITEVRVTGDLRDATVFYTVYGDHVARTASAAALESARGVLRSEVGRQIGIRHTPSLTFVADDIPENARHIDELLASTRAADEELAKARIGAEPAGDPDPYRRPREDDEDEE